MHDSDEKIPDEELAADETSDEDAEAHAEVIVTVHEKHLDEMETVTKRLEDAGLAVDHVLDFIGQVTGRCSGAVAEALKGGDGVDDVAVSKKIQLPPPGSLIQ